MGTYAKTFKIQNQMQHQLMKLFGKKAKISDVRKKISECPASQAELQLWSKGIKTNPDLSKLK